MTHNHDVITFNGQNGVQVEKCPGCGRNKWLGTLEDGCKECQSCYHKEHGMGPLPSDSWTP